MAIGVADGTAGMGGSIIPPQFRSSMRNLVFATHKPGRFGPGTPEREIYGCMGGVLLTLIRAFAWGHDVHDQLVTSVETMHAHLAAGGREG